jgi:hypothetical protein
MRHENHGEANLSGIASLANVPVSDQERSDWAFAHMAHHRDINAQIYDLVKIALPEYILDPIDANDIGTWEYQHQLMHDAQNELLGVQGQDLTGVDWKNQNVLAGWVFLNFSEHYQASQILLIG